MRGQTHALLMFAGLIGATPAQAACNSTQTERMCTDVSIVRLVSSEDGANSIQISAPTGALACSAVGGYLTIDMTKPYAAAMYSHLLSVHLAGRRVSIRLSDHLPTCTVTYMWSDQ